MQRTVVVSYLPPIHKLQANQLVQYFTVNLQKYYTCEFKVTHYCIQVKQSVMLSIVLTNGKASLNILYDNLIII